jgi:3-methyladenine DNA glycosylase AlkC
MADLDRKPLKDIFDEKRFQLIGKDVAAVWAPFDVEQFLEIGLRDHAQLTLLQRLRRVSLALRETLPTDYPEALDILYKLAPRTEKGFVSLFLPDFVGQYGLGHFAASMQALKAFTKLGSAEFAVREFLKADLMATLTVMRDWSLDEDEHVRRLASEGSRPRLPWSFKLQAIIDDPELTLPILVNLAQDPSLYVRKSVANHFNDVSKDHPEWLLSTLVKWPTSHPHSTWIKKRALRTLVKAGHQGALSHIGASEEVAVAVRRFEASPITLSLGDNLTLSVELLSQSEKPQQLVVDYLVHYVKKSGGTSPKVFKMKELTLDPHEQVSFKRLQNIKDFSTRRHYCGQHLVELMVNGKCLARSRFEIVE